MSTATLLPFDLWRKIFTLARREAAAVHVQRVVRGVRARSLLRHGQSGMPWNMPGLVGEGYDYVRQRQADYVHLMNSLYVLSLYDMKDVD